MKKAAENATLAATVSVDTELPCLLQAQRRSQRCACLLSL